MSILGSHVDDLVATHKAFGGQGSGKLISSSMRELEGGVANSARAEAATGQQVVFGQRRVGESFSPIVDGKGPPVYLAGRPILDVAADLRTGILHPDQLPIQAFHYKGQLVSANTRSLSALSEADLLPTNITIIQPSRQLLLRLRETPLLPEAPLPGPRVPVTPSRTDLTILSRPNGEPWIFEVPGVW